MKVSVVMGLTLLEVMDHIGIMLETRGINDLAFMMVMVPGVRVGGLKGAPKEVTKGRREKG